MVVLADHRAQHQWIAQRFLLIGRCDWPGRFLFRWTWKLREMF
jgi:hypothetical protein